MNIFEKLSAIQNRLKVTKDKESGYGGFKYRSAEKIFEEAKPICKENGCVLRVTDEVIEVAGRPYIKAIAELIDVSMNGDVYAINAVGHARIPDLRKGMDDCQLSGTASSYARKYAMCGLFCIDDNKDADALPPEDTPDDTKEAAPPVEKWRIIGNEAYIRGNDGEFYPLYRLSNRQLKALLEIDEFKDIAAFVEAEINNREKARKGE